MEDEKSIKAAKTAFANICAVLDGHDWSYDKDESKLIVNTSARGDDLSMEIVIRVYKDQQIVALHSPMPFTVPESMRKEMAVAVACANKGMVDGDFDYDYLSGKIIFRFTTSFRNSLISKDVYDYMLSVSCHTVDEYNDKFFMVINNKMSVAEIRNFIK